MNLPLHRETPKHHQLKLPGCFVPSVFSFFDRCQLISASLSSTACFHVLKHILDGGMNGWMDEKLHLSAICMCRFSHSLICKAGCLCAIIKVLSDPIKSNCSVGEMAAVGRSPESCGFQSSPANRGSCFVRRELQSQLRCEALVNISLRLHFHKLLKNTPPLWRILLNK